MALIYIAILLILGFRPSSRSAAMNGFISASLAIGINILIGLISYRPRPFVAHHVHMLLSHVADASFPSDHMTGSMTIALTLWYYNRKLGTPLVLISLFIGFSRIYVGHHYLTDVLGGILIGSVAAFMVNKLAIGQKILEKIPFGQKEQSTSRSM